MLNVDVQALVDLIDRKVREAVRDEMSRREPEADWLTMSEAMAYARFDSPNSIRAWVKAKKIHAYGKGRGLRFKRSEIRAVLDSLKPHTGTESAGDIRAFAERALKKGAH